MNLSKLYKNTFLIVLLSLVLTACATQKKVTTDDKNRRDKFKVMFIREQMVFNI